MASGNQVASNNQMESSNQEVASSNNQMESGNQTAPKQPRPEGNEPSKEYQLRKYLLLLATLVATVTYVAGLNLPGGVWQDKQADHFPGDPILHDTQYHRYLTFYYCNATAFAASLVVCLLLLVLKGKSTVWVAVLRLVMVLDLLGLMGAYAAGSCRDAFTTIYSSVLVSAVFAYIMYAFFTYIKAAVLAPSAKQDGVASPHQPPGAPKLDEQREVLMLLATFAVTITYVAGLNPPGGFWGDAKDGHRVSHPVLQDHQSGRYQAFFVCNTTAFVASLLIIILLLDKNLSRSRSVRFVALYAFIVIALFGLVGAYAAGSCREADNTIYVVSLAGAILAYIFLQVAINNALNKDGRCWNVLKKGQEKIKQFFVWLRNHTNSEPTGSGDRDRQRNEAREKAHALVLLLATLVAGITYQAGLDPPGGLWPDDRDGHKGGDSILLSTHPMRYKVFFYCNSAAFVASIVAIIMVESRFLLESHTLEAAMILDLFGLIGAFAAGSCRDVSTSIYVVALAGAVLVYVVIHIVFFTLDHKDSHRDADKLENRREVLLLLAILAATLTYQAGLTPPGGFWAADDNLGHHAGNPVLSDYYHRRYTAFFYCNATSFMASVALIVLLVNPNLYRPGIRSYALYVCMVAGMFGLMGAYAAGSSRNVRTSIYVLTLVAAVFAFVVLQVAIFGIRKYRDRKKKSSELTVGATGKGSSGQGASSSRENESSRSADQDMREYLMLLGILAASVTYQAGLKPPGGLWQDNSNGHSVGNSILHDMDKRRYHAFFYSNSTSFMASIVVIVLLLLLPWTLHDHSLPLWPMHSAILLDMLGLLAAYAAGSTREWETSRNVIVLVVPVLAYIAAYAVVSLFRKKGLCRKGNSDEHQQSSNDEEALK